MLYYYGYKLDEIRPIFSTLQPLHFYSVYMYTYILQKNIGSVYIQLSIISS